MKFKKIYIQKSLIESFFSLSILNGVNALLPLITLPYILRIIGTSNYGIYAYVYVLIQYLLLLSNYGFNYSATKQIAENRENREVINTIYNSVVFSKFLLLLSGVVLFAILSPLILENSIMRWMFIMGLGIVIGDALNPVWLFQGMEKMRYMTYVNVLSKSVFTLLIFVFIRSADDFRYILLINSFGFLLAGIVSVIIAKKQFGIIFKIPRKKEMQFQLKEGLALFGTSIGTNLYGNANVFILKFFVDDSLVGIYAAAEKIIKGLQSLTSPIIQAVFPYVGNNFIDKSIQYKLNKIKKLTLIVAAVLLLPNLLIFFGADLLMKLFGGQAFEASAVLFKIMSPIFTIGALNHILGITGLVNLNMQKNFFYSVIIAGIVSVVILLVFVPYFGVYAASTAMPISEIILLLICIYYLMRIRNK